MYTNSERKNTQEETMKNTKELIELFGYALEVRDNYDSFRYFILGDKSVKKPKIDLDTFIGLGDSAVNKFKQSVGLFDFCNIVKGTNGLKITIEPVNVNLPECSGVYFFFSRLSLELEYIGKAINIRRRVMLNHHKLNRDSHFVGYVLSDEIDSLERMLIKLNKPLLNTLLVDGK
mgnify:CR=1 FL=1